MGLIRILALLFLVYLVWYLIRGLFTKSRRASSSKRQGPAEDTVKSERKIISKDEGEYVDFEELE